jgi:hypothetical protein
MKLMHMLVGAFAALLVMMTIGCAGGSAAVWTDAAPPFDWQFTLDGRRFLLVHNGANGPACPLAPSQVACTWRVPGRHEFYASYVTPRGGSQLLVSFELPGR